MCVCVCVCVCVGVELRVQWAGLHSGHGDLRVCIGVEPYCTSVQWAKVLTKDPQVRAPLSCIRSYWPVITAGHLVDNITQTQPKNQQVDLRTVKKTASSLLWSHYNHHALKSITEPPSQNNVISHTDIP